MNACPHKAFLCSGQGAQGKKEGVSSALFAHAPDLATRADAFSAAVGRDVRTLLTTPLNPADTLAAHVALTAHSLLAWEALARTADDNAPGSYLMAGHSLGEIAALSCAGALAPEDALRLAVVRGAAMAEACARHKNEAGAAGGGGMLAVIALEQPGADDIPAQDISLQDHIQDMAQAQGVRIANDNSPVQVVLSGSRAALDICAARLEKTELRCVMLPTAGAFHTMHMASVAEAVLAFAETLEWRPLTELCISSLTGRALQQTRGSGFAAHLALQTVQPVQWLAAMRAMRRAGVTEVTESGADGTLTRLCQSLPGWNVRPVPLAQKLQNAPQSGMPLQAVP